MKHSQNVFCIAAAVALLVALMSLSARAAEDKEGLVAGYNFDEGTGAVAKDSSGNGLDATINAAKYVKHDAGFALEFDGDTAYVVAPQSPLLNAWGKPGKSYSVEAWFKSKGKEDPSLIEKESPGDHPSYPFVIRGPGPKGLMVFAAFDVDSGKNPATVASNVAWADDQWHQVVGVRDSAGEKFLLYVDGKVRNTKSDDVAQIDVSNSGPVTIGSRFAETCTTGFQGQIDNVFLFDRALSADEIKARYEKMATK